MYHIIWDTKTKSNLNFMILTTNDKNVTTYIYEDDKSVSWFSILPKNVTSLHLVKDDIPEPFEEFLKASPDFFLLGSFATLKELNSFLAEDHPELYI